MRQFRNYRVRFINGNLKGIETVLEMCDGWKVGDVIKPCFGSHKKVLEVLEVTRKR